MPNLLKARGLITYRNEINVADGAMDVADNVIIDEDDVVELRRGQGDFGDSLPLESERIKQVAEYKDLLIRHYNSTMQFDDGSGTFSDFSGSYQELEDGLRIKYLEANGNFYFTDLTGIKKISARNSAQVNTESVEDAGIPRAVSLNANVNFTTGGFLPPQSKVAYRVLWGKKDNNNNLLLGYPSERTVLTNTSNTVEVNESFQIKILVVPLTANGTDTITFETNTTSYFIWFDTSNSGDAEVPQTSEVLGRTAIKVRVDPASGLDQSAVASKVASEIANLGYFDVSISGDTLTCVASTSGDIEDPVSYLDGVASSSQIEVTMLQQGSITDGQSANATVDFTVPSGIDGSYFYQVYRTSTVSVPNGFSLDDIDPGDEMNLVYEGSPLDEQGALLTEISITDVTPESFRASADFLYTNPISGEGILQANAKPPVAKDITLFNGSNFYANTKTTHKLSTNLLSVESSRWTSGISNFIIGNEDITRKYTAVGETRIQDLTVNSSVLHEKAFYVNSARDEREYYVWYDEDGTAVTLSELLEGFSSTSVNPSSDFISAPTAHGLTSGDKVEFVLVSGRLPTNLQEGVVYEVNVLSNTNFQVLENGIVVEIIGQTGSYNLKVYVNDSELQGKLPIRVAYNTTLYKDIDTGSVSGGKIVLNNHGFEEGQEFEIIFQDGTLGGVSEGVVYLAHVESDNIIRVDLVGGNSASVVQQTPGNYTIKLYPTRTEIATKTAQAMLSTGDFIFDTDDNGDFLITSDPSSATVAVNWYKNGNVALGLQASPADPGFTYGVASPEGDGEDLNNQDFLLSNQVSVSLAIEETAKSLVKVINSDPLSPVNAYYTSDASDVPGAILLEAKTLEDKAFFIATGDSNITEDFSPNLNVENIIISTDINAVDSNQTDVELTNANNIFVNQEVFFYDTNGTLPFPNGKYVVRKIVTNTAPDPDTYTVTIDAISSISSGANNGAAFVAGNESDNEESLNRLYFSKAFQPEAVPLTNFIDIGPRDKAISRILPLRDNLFALKEDGVYIISGSSAPNFTVRLLDSSVSIIAPDSAVVLNNAIYALSDDGVVRISDTGVEVISRNIEDLIKAITNSRFSYETTSFGISYSSDRSYLLWLPTLTSDVVATQCYRYNTFTRTWTRFTISATCGLVASRDDKMYLGAGDRNVLTQERKNGDRTDYADRSLDLTIRSESVTDTSMKLNNVIELSVGDVIYQEQYVTLSFLRSFLRKLDLDPKISNDYYSSIPMQAGDKISSLLETINTKLLEDGVTVTDYAFDDDIVVQKDQFNNLIDELNSGEDTQFKNYRKVQDLTSYEIVVNNVVISDNRVDINQPAPFVEGAVTAFKGIAAKWQYAPQHFGDPSLLKQIRESTIIFDQNSFYGGSIAFASDQSADFIEVPFTGNGPGDWGENWGNGTWGGLGNDIPHRTLIPLEKQRCRYLTVQVKHDIAREEIKVNGISLTVRAIGNRAYR